MKQTLRRCSPRVLARACRSQLPNVDRHQRQLLVPTHRPMARQLVRKDGLPINRSERAVKVSPVPDRDAKLLIKQPHGFTHRILLFCLQIQQLTGDITGDQVRLAGQIGFCLRSLSKCP